jgi:PAS domain S-box-containing protein
MSRSTVYDMTERKLAERVQNRLSRALKLLSECNMALVHANDERALLGSVCRLIVETGGYLMAWIGVAEDDSEKTVRVVSRFGDETGYLDTIRVCWGDTDLGRGPTGTAIRTGVTQINQDCLNNPAMAPWREAAIKRGYQSSIALPLTNFGVLTVYSVEAHAFFREEVELLEELASDLTYGIESLRSRQMYGQAVLSLRLNEERLRALFASIKDAAFVLALQDDGTLGCFIEVNNMACALLGYSRAELLAMSPMDICAPECQADITPSLERLIKHKTAAFERTYLTKEGKRVPVEVSASSFTLRGKTMFVALARDITKRKNAERQIHMLSASLETAREQERRGIARELHDELGQMLTALKMDISMLRRELPPTEPTLEKLAGMTALVDETMATVRKISSDLHPAMLDDLGLKATLEWLVAAFKKRNPEIAYDLVIDLGSCKIEGRIATVAYRITQECLTNIVRHAGASKVHIVVASRDRQLIISLQDNGRGLPGGRAASDGFGLLGMRERVKTVDGIFEVTSLPSEGVSVDVTIPLSQTYFRNAAQ